MLAFVLADFVDGDDVRVLQARRGFRFDTKTLHKGFACEAPGQDHFEGDNTVPTDLAGFENDAHAAAGDFCEQFVIGETAWGCVTRDA